MEMNTRPGRTPGHRNDHRQVGLWQVRVAAGRPCRSPEQVQIRGMAGTDLAEDANKVFCPHRHLILLSRGESLTPGRTREEVDEITPFYDPMSPS